MNFDELVKQRYSCRLFQPQIPDETLVSKVLQTAICAPSAVNYQPWIFIWVRNSQQLERIHASYPREWFKNAPSVLVVCGNHDISWRRADGKDHCDIDVAIVTDHITLAATEVGLATCWVCNFDRKILSEALELPSNIEPIVMLPIGFSASAVDTSRHASKRKLLNELLRFETF